ncbi:MAG: hypothetical protein GY835_11675 [bacterium]|nr:hypothetical protein [bacterium]
MSARIICQISGGTRAARLETQILFDVTHRESTLSAIDIFLGKTKEINQLMPDSRRLSGQMPNLILLGYVSAVESYFRDILRRLILMDNEARAVCEKQAVSYGAALHHDAETLPEALLENWSFASDRKIAEAFRNFSGIKGKLPREVELALRQFSVVCQLRHCVVHRFGRLGSNNAIELGLTAHKECLDKPLNLTFGPLQEVLLICTNVVRVSNDFLFNEVMIRAAENGTWKWNLRIDKKLFSRYFAAFAAGDERISLKEAYEKFRAAYGNRKPSRKQRKG